MIARSILATMILLTLAKPVLAQDSARVALVRVQTDSLRAETCRGGTFSASGLTCRGTRLGPRVTVLRRLATRIDSIEAASPPPVAAPVASIEWAVGSRGTTHYNAPAWGRTVAGVDTVTVCGIVTFPNGSHAIATPPIRLRVLEDSATFVARSGSGLPALCGPALARVGGLNVDISGLPTTPVTWSLTRLAVGGVPKWRPIFEVRP